MAYRETDRVRRRKEATREQLIRAAEARVRGGGFADLQIQGVACDAGLGVGTVYRYFRSRDSLAAEVFRRATEREVAALEQALASPGSPVTRLVHGLAVFARRALRAPRLARALIAEPVSPEVEGQRLHYRRAYARHFRALLDEGVEAGLLAPQSAMLSANALVGAVAEALAGPLAEHEDEGEAVEAVCQFCLRAVGAGMDGPVPTASDGMEISHER
jgi:AcrR family transcriptional regulator